MFRITLVAGLEVNQHRQGFIVAGKHLDWTRDEHTLAFNLYCKIPFGRQHQGASEVIELAQILGRSPGSVALKLNNFSRLDPELRARGIKGMAHGAKGEIDVWRDFEDDPEALAFESERLLARFTGRTVEQVAGLDEAELSPEGIERDRMVRVRVNQRFFRNTVLAAYEGKCCVTGLAVPELLVASHIVGWAQDSKQRMNPRNGLCLNALHDQAFDSGLMYLDQALTVQYRPALRSRPRSEALDWLLSFEGKPIAKPQKFLPDPVLVEAHATRPVRERAGWLAAVART